MAEFLTTPQTSVQIEQIIRKAHKQLVLVSPFIKVSDDLVNLLAAADSREVKIFLIYRDKNLKQHEKETLSHLQNINLFACENLHSKCYFNESNMVITSMNLYNIEEKKSSEMGILIRGEKPEDTGIFNDARKEVYSLLRSSRKEEAKEKVYSGAGNQTFDSDDEYYIPPEKHSLPAAIVQALNVIFSDNRADAHCIRCGQQIPFNRNRPLCDDCYKTWIDFHNPYYRERYCHNCGKESKTTKMKPLCHSCFKASSLYGKACIR